MRKVACLIRNAPLCHLVYGHVMRNRLGTDLWCVVLLSGVLAGCGTSGAPVASDVPSQPRTSAITSTVADGTNPVGEVQSLVCPSGELSETVGGFLLKEPDGLPTRGEAVESWLRDSQFRGHAYRVSEDGEAAYVLRADDTPVARLSFIRHSGFTVHGVLNCID